MHSQDPEFADDFYVMAVPFQARYRQHLHLGPVRAQAGQTYGRRNVQIGREPFHRLPGGPGKYFHLLGQSFQADAVLYKMRRAFQTDGRFAGDHGHVVHSARTRRLYPIQTSDCARRR